MASERPALMHNLQEIEGFDKLSQREQNAVDVTMSGLTIESITGVKSKPIKAIITADNPFDIKRVANILHQLGVDIASTLQATPAENGMKITFQPKNYPQSIQHSEEIKQWSRKELDKKYGLDWRRLKK